MPAPPEVLQGHGDVGPVEVLREPEAEQQREPDRHVGIRGEVAVDLHGIGVDRRKRLRPGMRGGRIAFRARGAAAVYAYAVQIYCDFSGYTDMAIGSALLLGFQFPENFNAPYRRSCRSSGGAGT